MKSFSRPWNASTLAISTSCRGNSHGQPTGFLQGPLSLVLRCTIKSQR